MKKHYEMRFGGTGGQGMMLMGDVTAEAAGIKEGKEILLTKSYGPESRGGACRSEIIIDDDKIAYPVVSQPDMVVAMSQKACDSYTSDMAEDGILIADADLVKTIPERSGENYSIPITRLAKEATGKEIAANVVALGAVAVLSDELDAESVREAVAEKFPEKFRASNMAAFSAGAGAAEKLMNGENVKTA
jgi:2-oxoglutarate ferredoxin oxidoreductase subunit gamma